MPAGAVAGLCAACLLGRGAETDSGGGRGRFVPPSVETLAALFPRLEIQGLLGVGGMGAVRVAVHRLRKRYRALLLGEIAETLSDPTGVAEEMRSLRAALSD